VRHSRFWEKTTDYTDERRWARQEGDPPIWSMVPIQMNVGRSIMIVANFR
jgi:hypothetical protein